MSTEKFKAGDHVLYIPNHARGDGGHPDCEYGVVTSINARYVFVRYKATQVNGIATPAENLRNDRR